MLSQGCELVIEIITEHPLYTEVVCLFVFSFPVYLGGGGLVTKLCLTLVTLWTIAYQGPLSMDFSSRQEYCSGCHFLLQGIFPSQGSNVGLLHCGWILQ